MEMIKTDGKIDVSKTIRPLIIFVILLYLVLGPLFQLSFLPSLTGNAMLLTGSTILMYVVMSVSWTIFSGPTGYISLATAAFYGLGIYVAAIVSEIYPGFPLPLLFLLGGVPSFILAVLIGSITLRLRGVYFTIFTFGLVELLREFLWWFSPRLTGVPMVQMRFTFIRELTARQREYGDLFLRQRTYYYYMLILAVAVLAVAYIIKRTRFGKALVSIGESEDAASHVGINTTRTKIIAFAISSFFMGAVGSVLSMRLTVVDPGIAFDVIQSFLPVLMVIFGGMSGLAGPVVGAAIFTILREFLRTNYPTYSDMAIGIIMLLAILFMPSGVVGLVKDTARKVYAMIKRPSDGKKGGAGHADS